MSANLFAAIRPEEVGANHAGESIRPEEVGANHVGKFICRYSPVCMGRGAWMTSRGESCRQIYLPLFARMRGAWISPREF